MITCTLRGQLGNQMFQVATVIAHAKRLGVDYTFPERSGKRGQFPFMFPELGSLQKENKLVFENYREPRFGIYEPLPARARLNLQGYWQSELYFKEYKEEIIKLFNIKVPHDDDKIVSIHIRRGDSLKFVDKLPQPTGKYLEEAMSHFDNTYDFLVFSDDIEWCRNRFKGSRFGFWIGQDAKQTMGIMASCRHNIIVNSTFSWWGAYLNPNPNKTIISPSSNSWFGDGWKHKLSAQDIPCKDWIQIDY